MTGVVPRIRATAVGKSYGPTVALAGVSIDFYDGDSLAIMGPSGSGKSTLLLVLAGVVRPDEGEVWLRTASGPVEVTALDDDARSALRLAEFGFVFQQGLLIPELTALENVVLPLLLLGIGRPAAVARARRLLDGLGLAGLGDRRIGQLSGGQAQRVAIARATVTGAGTVFADEPTGALDSRTAAEVMDTLVAATADRGHSLVVVTHDDAVAARCSRVVQVLDGRITDGVARSL